MNKQVKSILVKFFAALALALACVAITETFADSSTNNTVQAAKMSNA